MRWKMASIFSSLSAASGCFQLILVLLLWTLILARVDTVSVDRSQEVSALLNFRDSNSFTSDYGAYWNSWKETDDTPCAWVGVACGTNSTVEQLDFSGWELYISVLEPLYNLTDLLFLDLSSNAIDTVDLDTFEGLCNVTGLIQLDLSSTTDQLSAPPSMSGCRKLRLLSLENNQMESLPTGLSDLVNLQFLSLANNSLTGLFPTEELGNFSSLVFLDLSSNFFTGHIPSLLNLTGLFQLILDNNNFTGFDEAWAIGAESLVHLSVSRNQLQGTIPSSITNLPTLLYLNMSQNNLSGSIPPGFSLLLNFSYSTLDLSQNQLTGEIPTDMLVQTNPDVYSAFLNLSCNLLTGTIPLHGSKIFSYVVLDLSYNNLSGRVPLNAFNNQNTAFTQLRLNNNQIFGDIVDVLFSGPVGLYAYSVQLQNNLFTGDLSRISMVNSSWVPNWPSVDFSNNKLQWSTSELIPDPIAATLQVLTSEGRGLQEFRAGGNNFLGTPLPTTCISANNSSILQVLDLSNSHLEGEILSAAFDHTCLPEIRLLNLSNNLATGPLSESIIGNQQSDFIIDVSNNLLSGPLPAIPQSSGLYNSKYFQGNGLCGELLPPCARGTGIQWWVLMIIICAFVIIVTATCLAASWRLKVYHKRHKQDADLIRTLLERDSATLMSLRELKKATGNFADSAQIGEGGFGTVYIGTLNDGTTVAIKRSKREGSEKDKNQFLNEVRILSQVNHRNLVKLMGCCMENKIAVLVFEFVSNGTLQEHLQGKIGPIPLTWKQRLHIAVQTADALNYLHSMASFPIYHRDVKSANILLDENLNAKVADFGISKLAPLQATHVSTAAIQGTMGYIDPEYYTSYQLTDKSDVYSFGVVLLELISGKAPLDSARGEEETSLVYFARPYIEKGNLEGLADPTLGKTYRSNGSESILSLGKIALKCLDMRSKARPSMQEVLKELQNVWADVNSTLDQLESHAIGEDSNEGLESGERSFLFDSSFTDSSSFVMRSDGTLGIQMSEHSGPLS